MSSLPLRVFGSKEDRALSLLLQTSMWQPVSPLRLGLWLLAYPLE